MLVEERDGFKVGDTVKVVREYPDRPSARFDGRVGTLTLIEDDQGDDYPFWVQFEDENGDGDWMHKIAHVIEAKATPVVIAAKDLSNLLVRNSASAQLAIELVSFLRDNGITVKFGN